MANKRRTASEALFETYLTEHGYEFVYEPDLGSSKRPDYLVRRADAVAVCEVKEFTTTAITDQLMKMGGAGWLDHKKVFGAVRNQIDSASRQLKPLAGSERPLVIALSNPLHAQVDLRPDHIIYAMYGNPTVRFAINTETGETVSPIATVADRDGALTAKHSYVSAVIVLHERLLELDYLEEVSHHIDEPEEYLRFINRARERGEVPDGSRRWIDVFHTLASLDGTATALPDRLFDARDAHAWRLNPGVGFQQAR